MVMVEQLMMGPQDLWDDEQSLGCSWIEVPGTEGHPRPEPRLLTRTC